MAKLQVDLTDELGRFVAATVESGRYGDASDVVRAALRGLEREEREYEARLAGLRAAMDAGDASGMHEGDVFGEIRRELGLGAAVSGA